MRLSGKVAVVTGSSRGIGREIALAMAREGADMVINYSRSKTDAEESATQVKALGKRALVVKADVTDRPQVEDMMKRVVEEFGHMDVLVNNAGGFPIKPFQSVTDSEWEHVIKLDLTSVFLCSQVAFSHMRSQRSGSIINISSVSGLVGAVGMVPYSAAKGGVMGLTKALAREVASSGLTVNAIAPGIIETDTTLDVFPEAALKAYVTYQVPLGRLGRAEDVVGLTVFLASNEARYITGQVYAVDGGFTMQ